MRRIAAIGLAVALTVAGSALASCSSTSSGTSDSAASPTAKGEMVGGDPETWAPIEIQGSTNGTTVDMVVGQTAIFTDLPDFLTVMVESSDPAVVEASQAEGEGDVTAVAGLVARGAGTATITVTDTAMAEDAGGASNVIIEFTVNVSAE